MEEKVGGGMENSMNAQLLKASLKNSDVPAVSDSSSPSTPRFSVKQVNLDPTPSKLHNKPERPSSPRTSFLDTSQSPSRPLSMVDVTNTIGYATHDAVPMTVFYRNDNSHSDTSKARPTLRELRKGFEEEHEQQLPEEPRSTNNVENGDLGSNDIVVRKKPDKKAKNAPKFGWLKGVMLRCLLNIWGVMLYLRLSWVTGQAGIGWSSVIVVLSAVVTMLTTLSMSAVCTNGEVKGGGAYYLISRSLGPEFGGSIGLIFSVANAVAVALYVVGFAETVKDLIKEEHGDIVIGELNVIRIIGIGTVVLLLCVTLIGLEWVVRTQMFLLCILIVSIVDVIIGTFIGPQNEKSRAQGFVGLNSVLFKENFGPDYRDGENFFSVFAVFFPAATGILAGVNISGDLKDAQKAIPKGTLWAILISTIVYVLLGWLAGACVLRDASGVVTAATAAFNVTVNTTIAPDDHCSVTKTCDYGLMNDFQVMEKISAWGPIVTGGIFAATLSSALASLVGAPKTFQALCKDKIFPYIEYFGHGVGPGDEPRRGYILTFLIAGGFIAIGDLNVIAPVISNFFLMSYALINYAVFAASLGKSPGWRPSFKYYNMWVSLLGAMICIVIMFLINWWAALVTIVIIITLYKYVDIKKPEANWGSSVQAYTYIRALRFTYRLNTVEDHVKNFRPQCLVLTGAPSSRPDLVRLVSQITRNVGLMVCAQVKVGSFGDTEGTKQDAWLRSINVRAFHTTCTAPSLREGVRIMLQTVGLGKLKPNTVVLGYKRDWKNLWRTRRGRGLIEEYVNIVHDAFELNNGVAILRLKGELDLKEWAACDDDDWLPERVPTDNVPNSDPALSENFPNVAELDSESNGKVFNVERCATPESTEPSDSQARPRKGSVLSDSELLQACIDELRGRANSKDSDWSGSLMEKTESDGEDEGEGESRVSSPEATEFDKEEVLVADRGADPVEELTQKCDKSNEGVAEIGIKGSIKVTLNEEPIQDEEDEGNETDEATLLNKPEPTTAEEVTFKEKPKGTIDVWWLWDDGGLTILIPYLLSTHNYWKGCKLRVFTLASSSTLKSRELKMANLMKKFRIDISSVVEVQGINAKPSSKSIRNFMQLPVKEEFKEIRTLERDKKTMRNIRLGELIREHSNDAKLLVLTLPVPKVEVTSPLLYMSWLEVLSAVAPPVLMIRGNQQSVLTFYS